MGGGCTECIIFTKIRIVKNTKRKVLKAQITPQIVNAFNMFNDTLALLFFSNTKGRVINRRRKNNKIKKA